MPPLGGEPRFVLEGRAAELGALSSALDEACGGHGRIAVVTGEGGIGKSALVTSLAERAAQLGVAAVFGSAWEFADAPAYFPVLPCLGALGLDAVEARAMAPFALWEEVLGALSRVTRDQPQVWILEDLHAADLQTLDLLSFLAQPLRVLGALVVVTARAQDPRLDERGQQRLRRMARDGLDLRLGPLAGPDVERLARRYAGELSAAAVREIGELTSGNPLFVVECARALRAGGSLGKGGSPTIRQVALERVQLLPTSTRELVESAAVLGREFTAALVARLHDVLPARVIDSLAPALKSGVLVERAPGSYLFSHVIVHEAVYGSLSAERRSQLHARAEQALARLPDSPELSLERARHLLCSLTPDTEAAAVAFVLHAGGALEASGAFDRAHALYARLREKIAQGEVSEPLSGRQLLHMASIAERAGQVAEGRALSLSVLKAARARGDHQLFALAALELGRTLRPGLVDEELVAALREALQHFDDEDSPLGCRLLSRLAAALQPASDPQQPVEMATRAIQRAERIGEPALLLEALDVAGSAYVDFAPIELRLHSTEALLERALAARDMARVLRARARLAFDRARLGSFEAFERLIEQMLHEAEDTGQAQAKIRPLLMASLAAASRGKLAESDAHLAESEQLLSLTDDPGLTLSCRAHRLSRALMLHHDREIEAIESTLPRLARGLPDAELVLSGLRAALRGRLERLELAREDLRVAWSFPTAAVSSFLTLLAEVAALVREQAICVEARARLLPFLGQDGLGGHVSVSYEGPIDRLLGLLDAALGDSAGAELKLRATLALAERRGFDAWVAQGRYDLGRLLAELGRHDEARGLFAGAAELGERSGMPGLVARALARAQGSSAVATPRAQTPPASSALSMRREGELYRIELGALSARIRASRGAELLARLVEAPDQEIHVLALASDEAGATTESNAGDSIDKTALRKYRARLRELESLLEQAEAHADSARAEGLRREQAALEREVARALGLGGRARQAGSTTERARVNVQRRLKDALERIAEASPELGAWLGRAVRTGTYCSYRSNS